MGDVYSPTTRIYLHQESVAATKGSVLTPSLFLYMKSAYKSVVIEWHDGQNTLWGMYGAATSRTLHTPDEA